MGALLVYAHWTIPPTARDGLRAGRVTVEFTVERDGRMSAMRVIEASGTPALDRAAEEALSASRFPDLPLDFLPDRLTMQVSFSYNLALESAAPPGIVGGATARHGRK